MYHHAPRAALLACAFGLSFSAQAQQPSVPVAGESGLVKLRYATFDPLDSEPAVPASLRDNGNLWIVQFRGTPTELGRSGIRESGARLHGYLPDNAYVVRMPEQLVDTVSGLEGIRWVGRYSAAYRIDPALIAALDAGRLEGTRKYNMVVTDKHTDKPALAAGIQALGGAVVDDHFGSLLFTVALTGEQLPKAAQLEVHLRVEGSLQQLRHGGVVESVEVLLLFLAPLEEVLVEDLPEIPEIGEVPKRLASPSALPWTSRRRRGPCWQRAWCWGRA